jgi:rubrerythrin
MYPAPTSPNDGEGIKVTHTVRSKIEVSLNTFGAILTFAIDLEGAMEKFYEGAGVVAGDADTTELFENYAKKSSKRKQRLTAVRQDNVTEMVLEPISGLNQADYEPVVTAPSDRPGALAEAIRLEERAERFYQHAGPKLNVTEPRRAFQKLAQENTERLFELRAIASN